MKKKLPKNFLQAFNYSRYKLRTIQVFFIVFPLIVNAQISATFVPTSQIKVEKSFKINLPVVESPLIVDRNAIYSNVTTYAGRVYTNYDAALQPGSNTITTLVGDSLGLSGTPPFSISTIRFSVANIYYVDVTARPLIRFWNSDGDLGGPGTLVKAINLSPLLFPFGTVNIYSAIIPPFILNTGGIWVGITFDDDSATTGATVSQLNALGQGVFDPVDKGFSNDFYYQTVYPGDFASDYPYGGKVFYNFGGAPVANFGWELVSSTALPVTFTNFNVHKNGLTNIASWTTSQEFNASYFTVEQSTDGINFREIGKVKAAGISSTSINYQYADKTPVGGLNYYRIHMVDMDNSGKYSEIKSIKNAGLLNFTVFPNPVQSKLTLSLDALSSGNAIINITDVNGRSVYESKVSVISGSNNLSIDVTNFSKGAYFIKINVDSENYTSKFNRL